MAFNPTTKGRCSTGNLYNHVCDSCPIPPGRCHAAGMNNLNGPLGRKTFRASERRKAK